MLRVFTAFAAIAFLIQIPFASAGEYGTRDEAVAMVKRVEDMFTKALQRRAPTRRSKRFPTSRLRVSTIATSTRLFTT